jgi:hypothetical protein
VARVERVKRPERQVSKEQRDKSRLSQKSSETRVERRQ